MQTPGFIGVLLIILGLVAFAYTTGERCVDPDLFQMTAEKDFTAPLPPVVGAGALIGGFLLLCQGRNNV